MMFRPRMVVLPLVGLCLAATVHAEEFDRTIAAARGTRLQVRLFGGEVVVRGWDQDAVRVRATHFRTDTIDIGTGSQAIRVSARATRGTPHAIDIRLEVPAWMGIDIKGTYLDIAVEGTRSDVAAETVRGDVRVTGGAGVVTLKSVEGEIVLEGAQARASLSGVNNGIRVVGLRGDLFADNVSGAVTLDRVTATAIEVSTVSGDISWDGGMTPAGRYQFVTHGGDIDVTLPERSDVTVVVRPFDGLFRSTFPLTLPDEAARGKRFSVVFGTGAARVDLETFSGTISLRRPGA